MRFVVLHHTGFGADHFDLMFERSSGGPLETFRSPCWPILSAVDLVALGDHRNAYLTYEGPVSGNRGEVRRVALGEFERSALGDELVYQIRESGKPPQVLRVQRRGTTKTMCATPAEGSDGEK